MTVKRKISENDTTGNNLKCTLVPHRFTDEEMSREFPNAAFDYEGLAAYRGDELDPVAFLCMELAPGPACTLHLWIPKENRTQENIAWLTEKFYSELHPWVKSRGKCLIVVNCAYDLVKTKELFETFGFDPVAIWFGVMEIKA